MLGRKNKSMFSMYDMVFLSLGLQTTHMHTRGPRAGGEVPARPRSVCIHGPRDPTAAHLRGAGTHAERAPGSSSGRRCERIARNHA